MTWLDWLRAALVLVGAFGVGWAVGVIMAAGSIYNSAVARGKGYFCPRTGKFKWHGEK